MKEKHGKAKGVFSAEDVSMFCTQMALILRSAIPLEDGVAAIEEEIEDKAAKAVVDSVREAVSMNTPFYQALQESGAFPAYMVNMVEIGEKAGKLDDVLAALGQHYEREAALKKNIKRAVVYPLLLVLMMAVVISVLVIKVLPVFSQVFRDLGSEMSAFSTFVMNMGMGVGKYAFIIVLVLVALVLCAFLFARTKKGGAAAGKALAHFGPTRKLSSKIASARFASVMSMMLSSGYSTDEALELVPKIIPSDVAVEKIEQCREKVAGGMSFAEAIREVNLFPGIYGRMVGVGAKTGSLDTVMQKLAALYEEEVDDSIDRAVAVIEPALVAVLSVIIGAILLSVMLPLMGIMSSIG